MTSTEPARPAALRPAAAAALVFLASGAVLVLEVIGLRLVGPYVGVSLQTSSAVIGVALAAIAYGAWSGGWLADRIDPRRLLGPALLLAALATAVTLPIVRYAGELLRGASAGGILLLTALAVFVPSALLSAVPPLVVKLQLADLRQTGQVVGRLSSIGTLGGITATLGTGFVLVAAFPSSAIVLGLAGLLGGAGIACAVYLRHTPSRSIATTLVIGLCGGVLAASAPSPCDVETAYHCARIVADPQRPSGRLLLLNSARHSYVDLSDPQHLEFAYTQWIGAFADVLRPAGSTVDGLHLGGGGFTIPRYLNATRPGSRQLVVEIDARLVALDRARLGVRESAELAIRTADARTAVAGAPHGAYDLVVGDAFGHYAVPWHLTTREFVAQVRGTIRPGGAYALNVIDYPPARLVRAEVATVAAVFRYVALAAGPESLAGTVSSGNFVLFASDAPLPLDALRSRLGRLPRPATLVTGAELATYTGRAQVLTDDHAPVDQLLVRP